MKRTLQITIDANRVTCGKCRLRSSAGPWCNLFDAPLYEHNEGVRGLRRCAPCLAAEREASK